MYLVPHTYLMALFSPLPLTDSGELAASILGLFLFPYEEKEIERERVRKRKRKKERKTEGNRERERKGEQERNRKKQRERKKERERKRAKEIETEKETERERKRERERERKRKRREVLQKRKRIMEFGLFGDSSQPYKGALSTLPATRSHSAVRHTPAKAKAGGNNGYEYWTHIVR